MGDIIFLAIMATILWFVYAIATKRSVIPFKEKKEKENMQKKDPTKNKQIETKSKKANKPSKNNPEQYVEEEPDLFSDLLKDIKDIRNHMIHLNNDKFVLIANVVPCNYFLLSDDEQDSVDGAVETWLASITDYQVQPYLQNRYIDLSVPLEEMAENMRKADNLPSNALEYGRSKLEDLQNWQYGSPRYETMRYLIFTYKADLKKVDIQSQDDYEEKVVERAFQEMNRRLNNARTHLSRGRIEPELLTTDGIIEVLYHMFNRRRAIKLKYRDIREREQLSLYSTAKTTQEKLDFIKELSKENEKIS